MNSTESIPVLHIRAKSNYEVGFVTGKTFKGWIQDFLNVSEEVKLFREFYSNSKGKTITEGYLDVAKKSHPKIVSEIQGIADGAEVSFNDVFLLQISSEILFCHSKEILKKPPNPSHEGLGCTDVLVNRTKARIIGHNDDWHRDVVDRVFMVHVTITDDKDNVVEQFISFSYPGFLAGFCFGMNKSLVITHNTLIPKEANTNAVPMAILIRSLYAYTSVQDVINAMENKPFGCAYATATHIASIESTEMCSLELHPIQGKLEINVYKVPHESQNDECYYCHQNYYKQIKGADAGNCRGSHLRDQRASELFPVKDIEDVKAILGDTKEDFEPIYRKPRPDRWSPTVETSATAIFDITNRLLHVYRSNPKLSSSPCLTLPFL